MSHKKIIIRGKHVVTIGKSKIQKSPGKFTNRIKGEIFDADCNWNASKIVISANWKHRSAYKLIVFDGSLKRLSTIETKRRIFFVSVDPKGEKVYVSLEGKTIRSYSLLSGKCKLALKKCTSSPRLKLQSTTPSAPCSQPRLPWASCAFGI